MDDETLDDHFATDDDVIETVPDNVALEVGDDTVVTSAAPPEHDDSPWPDRRQWIRGSVVFTSGSTR
jgi:hypothetical protein